MCWNSVPVVVSSTGKQSAGSVGDFILINRSELQLSAIKQIVAMQSTSLVLPTVHNKIKAFVQSLIKKPAMHESCCAMLAVMWNV